MSVPSDVITERYARGKLGYVRYRVFVNGLDVSQRLTQCVWEHTTREVAERAIVEIALHPTKDDRVMNGVGTGASLFIMADADPVFQGRIEVSTFTEKRPVTLELIAYGTAFTLGANEEDVTFPDDYTPMDVVDLITQPPWGMPLGRNEWPNVSLGPKTTYRAKTLGFIVEDTNTKLRLLGHGDFYVRSFGNGIELVRANPGVVLAEFTPDNTEIMTDKQSTQDLVTRVKLVGSYYTNDVLQAASVQTVDNPNAPPGTYGVRQRIVTDASAQANPEEAAATIFENLGEPQRMQIFEAPDVPQIRKGDAVSFRVGTADGILVLTGVHHDAKTQRVRMEVDTTGRNRHRVAATTKKPSYGDPYAGQPLVPTQPPATPGVGPGNVQ